MKKLFIAFGICVVSSFVPALAADSSFGADTNPNTVVAEVNGQKITLGELQQKSADKLFQAQNNYYQAERKVLDEFLEDRILEDQAKQEHVTVDELLQRHVKSTLPGDPSEEALRVYYEGLDAKDPYEMLRPQIVQHIRELRFQKAKAAYVASLRSQTKVWVTLPAPRATIDVAEAPMMGPQNAAVTVIEFADYECPYCQQVAPAVQRLTAEYKNRVTFVYKDTPLPGHAHAEKAAEAARCAGVQGKYWDYHDTLFASKQLEIPDLKQDARKLNLDEKAFDTCLDSGQQAPVVKRSLEQATLLQLAGTPAFFINGRYLSGALSYEQLRAAIEEELATANSKPKQTAMR